VNVALTLFVFCFREKKREKERDELWKRLGELELNQNANNVGNLNSSDSNAITDLQNSTSK
jgi:hypothetical protein